MRQKFLAILLATLMSAIMLASVGTIAAEEDKNEILYYDNFDIPTDNVPKDIIQFSVKTEYMYLDLICYNAYLTQPTGRIKTAYFSLLNNGNQWADSIWYTDVFLNSVSVTYYTHTVSLGPGASRSCARTFIYEPNPPYSIPFQCWTDSGQKFAETDQYGNPSEANNWNPVPPVYYGIT